MVREGLRERHPPLHAERQRADRRAAVGRELVAKRRPI